MQKKVLKRLVVAFVIGGIIITGILYFTFKYKTKPDSVSENVWTYGEDLGRKYIKVIKKMKSIEVKNIHEVNMLNEPNNTQYRFISNQSQFDKWVYEDFIIIKETEQTEFTSDDIIIVQEVSAIYEQLLKCDLEIRAYDVENYKVAMLQGTNQSTEVVEEKKRNIVNSLKALKIKTEKLENIYGFPYSKEIDNLIEIINEKI